MSSNLASDTAPEFSSDIPVAQAVENTLKPVMILVFTLKIAVAALLVGNVMMPNLHSAEAEMVAVP
ncbi:hypothetical protein HGO34_01240 [Agrobacterium vitis]|uniref:Uncharacterized protein n=1 Tax=Agrobacterium vitis TaxID=373 RepID=A0AAE4W9F9_AGRVI|nr:hypothetical protein [Agrobacterium vitis]MCF1498545.1 hypothetical protein [Allorhizobium sp. Av2]MCM2438337.1 hypothetical protein [Agrobacterium vitis]MUZ56281.1 hypothetical protein [Agrobacterium vitis]MVA64582.1 hypothetical protein [Agrobacterium vitis]MVA85553.1 hypothetical protein [Agrobacterium vitis]